MTKEGLKKISGTCRTISIAVNGMAVWVRNEPYGPLVEAKPQYVPASQLVCI